MSRDFNWDEVKKHNTENNAWIVINNQVFDVSKFLADHPGGKKVLVQVAGQDATNKFNLFHKPETLIKYSKQLKIGVLNDTNVASTAMVASKPVSIRVMPNEFGELVPYGDPNWYQGFHSPYYNESHKKFRAAIREFVDKELMPY